MSDYSSKKFGAMLLLSILVGIFIVGITTWGVNYLHILRLTEEGKERMLVEVQLSIIGPTASNFEQRPIKFGLVKGEQYDLRFSAEKFMRNVDAEMYMRIDLPQGLQMISGDLEWSGRDKQKTIRLRFEAVNEGDFLINGTATNLDNNFTTTASILICVRNTPEEAIKSM